MSFLKLAACAAAAALISVSASAATLLAGGTAGWEGWQAASGWRLGVFTRPGDPFPTAPHYESSETTTGSLMSPPFTVTGEVLRLSLNGWSGARGGGSCVLRVLDASGTVVASVNPPDQDPFATVVISVAEQMGKSVRLELRDDSPGGMFAWVGIAKVEMLNMPKTTKPRNVLMISPKNDFGIWTITKDRLNRACLNTLTSGEKEKGSLCSPKFELTSPKIRIEWRGWSGRDGKDGLCRMDLRDASTQKVLATLAPPCTDSPTWAEMDTSAFVGKKVQIWLVDDRSDMGFSWIGVDKLEAGDNMRVDFSNERNIAGWYSGAAGTSKTMVGGVPFAVATGSMFAADGIRNMPVNLKLNGFYLLGMTNSVDVGGNVWEDPRNAQNRNWVGDLLGNVVISYADGKKVTYPIVLGESAFWGTMFTGFPDPYGKDMAFTNALDNSLRLYPKGPSDVGRYIAYIKTDPGKQVTGVQLIDNPKKPGFPMVFGITAELSAGQPKPKGAVSTAWEFEPGVNSLRSLLPKGVETAARTKAINALMDNLYNTVDRVKNATEPIIPQGYNGPQVLFEGTPEAKVLSGIFHHNIKDMLDKLEPNGFYNTSTLNAPSWGGYQGFGSFLSKYNSYHGQMWTRDMGRTLVELACLGYPEKSQKSVEYALLMSRVWETGPQPGMDIRELGRLDVDGVRLPRHICRRLNYPTTVPGEGCFENDGHALISLAAWKVWQRIANPQQWWNQNREDLVGLGDWIVWQLDNPKTSGAKGVLRTDSECSGGVGYSVYADYLCLEALLGLAEMADGSGDSEKAKLWRATAKRLEAGIDKYYITNDKQFGRMWTLQSSGWPNQSTVLGPVIVQSDRAGFLPEQGKADWRDITTGNFNRMLKVYQPVGFYGVAMGYGQGFTTQAALMLDRMKEASVMLDWTARIVYDPRQGAYIVPEGSELHPDGKHWHRTGDLGNGVQEAEIVKAIRLVVGIDDTNPNMIGIYPRMPLGWKKINAVMPVLVTNGAKRMNIKMELQREGKKMLMQLRPTDSLGKVSFRVGPFAKKPAGKVSSGSQAIPAGVKFSGDSWWVSFTAALPQSGLDLSVE